MDVSNILYFFCSGEGKGESGATARGGGGFFFIENSRRGGGLPGGGGEGSGGCLRGIWGGGEGAKYLFFGAEMSTK